MKEQNINKINWELLARDIAGELSAKEHEELNRQLHEDQGVEEIFGQAKEVWGDSKYASEVAEINTDQAWNNVSERISKVKVKLIHLKKLMTVAAMVVIIISGYFMYSVFSGGATQSIVVAHSQMQTVNLPDGTDVAVNGGSSLTYPKEFKGKMRTVELDGEAFFNVRRDESRPFIIKTKKVSIQVLGTSFNVKAYSPDQTAIVTVATGKVQVTVNEGEETVILTAGESVIYNATSAQLEKQVNTNQNYQSWKTKEIVFDENTALTDVFSTIEEVYQIHIQISDSTLIQDEVLKATFSQYTLEHILNTVCTSFGLQYREENGVYIIY